MDIKFLIPLFIAALGGMFSLQRQLQMLQLNSYFAKRYAGWLKGAFSLRSFSALVLTAAEMFFILIKPSVVAAAVIAAVSLVRIPLSFSDRKKAIKKLVYTARVKRMAACAVVLSALLTVLPLVSDYIAAVSLLFFNITPLMCFAVLFVMKPAEIAVSRHYVRDAENMLHAMPNMRVIGITGSYGKTSVKYILGRLLNEKYNVLITPENFNTPMGIVRTVRENLKPQHEVFCAEMGAKKVGDIKELCDITNPDMGIITSIGYQHLDTFGSIGNITDTKFELADSVKVKNGVMFLNTDNEYIRKKANEYKHISYGCNESADYRVFDIKHDRSGLKFSISHNGEITELSSPLLGEHNAVNITGAFAVASTLGVETADIVTAVRNLKAPPHRLEMKPYIAGSVLIDDAYNSNPSGCLAAAKVLGSFVGMRRILVTPGLVELGEKEYECNKDFGAEAARNADVIILVGKKRSVPIADGIGEQGFDRNNLHIVESFRSAYEIFAPMCNDRTVVMFENDLPDNYLK